MSKKKHIEYKYNIHVVAEYHVQEKWNDGVLGLFCAHWLG